MKCGINGCMRWSSGACELLALRGFSCGAFPSPFFPYSCLGPTHIYAGRRSRHRWMGDNFDVARLLLELASAGWCMRGPRRTLRSCSTACSLLRAWNIWLSALVSRCMPAFPLAGALAASYLIGDGVIVGVVCELLTVCGLSCIASPSPFCPS